VTKSDMVYFIILALLILLPGIPLSVSWWQFFGRYSHRERFAFLPITLLISATLSFCWIMVGIFWDGVLGPSYSTLRYTLITANLLIDITASGLGALVHDPRRWWLISSAGAVSIDWYYVLVVNIPAL
jgi:hypothetical protein